MTGAEVALVAALASAAMAATQTAIQASNQAKMARYNAAIADQNATAAQRQVEADSARQERLVQKHLAKRRTAFLSGGVSLEGSPLDLLEDLAMEGRLDVLNIRQRGLAEARQFSIASSKSRFEADAATTLGVLGVGQQLTSGLSGAVGNYTAATKKPTVDVEKPRVVRSTGFYGDGYIPSGPE